MSWNLKIKDPFYKLFIFLAYREQHTSIVDCTT